MIKIQTLDKIDNIEHIVVPTIFPDGTSQVWKLPKNIIDSLNLKITWYFEAERELIDLLSLRLLLFQDAHIHLHVPFLPYARQDKNPSNESTYNLHVFAAILNLAGFNLVTSVDVHNVEETAKLINKFKNIRVSKEINKLGAEYQVILYPDKGAYKRYSSLMSNKNQFNCTKERNQLTGEINNIACFDLAVGNIENLLIVDDICDGGMTFIKVAEMLKKRNPNIKIDLYVTHGIFSKGKQVLLDAGIENIYTTNSLLKNQDGFKV